MSAGIAVGRVTARDQIRSHKSRRESTRYSLVIKHIVQAWEAMSAPGRDAGLILCTQKLVFVISRYGKGVKCLGGVLEIVSKFSCAV